MKRVAEAKRNGTLDTDLLHTTVRKGDIIRDPRYDISVYVVEATTVTRVVGVTEDGERVELTYGDDDVVDVYAIAHPSKGKEKAH